MAAVDDLYSQIPIGQIASQLGIDAGSAGPLIQRALPALLAGMQANAKDPGGASSLAGALGQHAGTVGQNSGGLLDQLIGGGGQTDFGQVDTTDGDKIVGHVFGDNRNDITDLLGSMGGGSGGGDDGGIMARLLPLLAPLVMGWVSRQVGNELGGAGGLSALGTTSPGLPGAPANEDALESMLGTLLGIDSTGGGGGGGTDGDGGLGDGGMGDLLGGLLGAGTK